MRQPKKTAIRIACVTALAAAAILPGCGANEEPEPQDPPVITQTGETPVEKVPEGMTNIQMNRNPVVTNGTDAIDLGITNPENNNYPLAVEIRLKENGETLYKSDPIPLGDSLGEVRLLRDLEPGTYLCIAYFSSIDEETGETVHQAGMEFSIVVGEPQP